MDVTRFDDLTKGLATSPSRRAALKTIAATTIGGILGLAGMGTAFAGEKCGDRTCLPGDICCNVGHGVMTCIEPGPRSSCPPH
jgi:hypothetical protein